VPMGAKKWSCPDLIAAAPMDSEHGRESERFGGPSLAPSYFFTTRDVHEFSRFNVVEWPGVQHEGYVTRYKIPNGSGLWQWNWVCQECFAKLSETMQWRSEDP